MRFADKVAGLGQRKYGVAHHEEYPGCDVSYVIDREGNEVCTVYNNDSKAAAEKIAAALEQFQTNYSGESK
jgi:hypothetical protein